MSPKLSDAAKDMAAIKKNLSRYQKRAVRVCLRCNKSFDSEGPWNRLCGPCHSRNTGRQPHQHDTGKGFR